MKVTLVKIIDKSVYVFAPDTPPLAHAVAHAAEAPQLPSVCRYWLSLVRWIANSVEDGLPLALTVTSSDDDVGFATVGADGVFASVVKFNSVVLSVDPALFSA